MLVFDLRDALRGLARDRLYSAITILTLALTVGATRRSSPSSTASS